MGEAIKIAYGRNFLFLKKFYDRIVKIKRNEINNFFFSNIKINQYTTLLDVGTTSSMDSHQNLIVKKFYNKKNITCISNQNLAILKKKYPEIRVKIGDAKQLPFKNDSFDVVACTATLEHVGNDKNQIKVIKECFRVSKKYIFLTTPNRWFPIEFHTRLPLVHFLPKNLFRLFLILIGDNFLSKEENLNLLGKSKLKKYFDYLKIKKYLIKKIYLFGLCSNFVVIIKK
jgi:ubiquinone/menaquinone biosynthesis C-methylase UbiE